MEGTKDSSWTVSFRDVVTEVHPIIHGLLGPMQATPASHNDPRDSEPIRPGPNRAHPRRGYSIP